MKQADLDKQLRAVVKTEAKRRGWKDVAGFAYWTIGPLFFSLLQTARVKQGTFHATARVKWLALDHALWRVLGMSGNLDGPFSLHANGAFVLTGQEVLDISSGPLEWLPGVLGQEVFKASEQAFSRALAVAAEAQSLDSYLQFVHREHEELLRRYPHAAVNAWKETVLAALITGDLAGAAEVARSRIAAGDAGGFVVEGKTFFERTLELCERSLG